MEHGRPPELRRVRGDATEGAEQALVVRAERSPLCGERVRVRLLLRAEARETAAAVERAERPAAGLRHWAEAGDAARDHHAGRPCPLALDADAVPRDVRATSRKERADDLEQLRLADRATLKLEVDRDVVGDRCRRAQGRDVRR